MFRFSNSIINVRHCILQQYPLQRTVFMETQSARYFAKGKDKKKEDKGKGVKKRVEINENFLGEVLNVEKLMTEMDHNISKLKESFTKYVTVRTAIGAIENVPIRFNEKKYSLIELGQIVRKNPKVVSINMSAFPQALPAVLQALNESGMNLSPQQDGTTIFVPVPRITREHRENLSKNAKVHFIKCRDGIRDVQNKCLKTIKSKQKDGRLSEDTGKQVTEQVKSLSDNYVTKAEKMLETKQTELLGGIEKDD